ncbi:MAG TPA: tetratricopeptide repeat protein [Phnomibacter sp.]|nr:tetratricopeptide repeat protein [Phnomibacter sp.]
MSTPKNVQFDEVQANEEATQVIRKARGFWEKYSKPIVYGGGALIILLAGYYGFKKFYSQPREEKANEAIWHAQQYFEQDSLRLALNGDGQYAGFEKVAKTHSGTKAGNLAKFYAGICNLRLGDYKKAVDYLGDFSTPAKEIQAIAYSRLADAYAELGKKEEALKNYEKAARHFPEQESLSAENLFRAGLLAETMGKNDQAIKYYKEIKEKYGRTEKGYQVDKYLARLGVVE